MSSLQPLYDVKDRLEAAAIAGTGLLAEDFRLQRAAEALKPLAAASPVLGKISAGLDALLAAPEEQRPALLLDTLALVDAVAYTQGRWGLDGDLTPLPTGAGTYLPLPHSHLSLLLGALTGTGGRRETVVQLAWENHPESFQDYRVLPALIAGLGDGSSGAADQIAGILKQMGPSVVPLLKEGFDPKGKKAMARRVEVIDAIAGGAEEDWYLSQLPLAGKDVRAPLIYTLRHSEENYPRLRALYSSERGTCQDRAVMAIACLSSPEAAAFMRALSKENPMLVLHALAQSTSPVHADLVAEMLGAQLDKVFGREQPNWSTQLWQGVESLLQAALGKDSPAMLELYRQLAAWYAGDHTRWRASGPAFQSRRKLPLLAPFLGKNCQWPLPAGMLSMSLWRSPSPALRALAEELARSYGWPYLQPLVIAVGLTESPAALWERFAPVLADPETTRDQRLGILSGLGCLTGRLRGRPVLDRRWAETLTGLPLVPMGDEAPLWRASGYKNNTWVYTAAPLEIALYALDPGDGDSAGAFRANLERIQRQPGVSVDYMMESLRYRGWKDWRGMLPALVLAAGERLSPLDLERWYREYIGAYMSDEEKAAEIAWFTGEVRAKRLKVFVTWSEERVQQLLENFQK